jgi:polyphosphate kinase
MWQSEPLLKTGKTTKSAAIGPRHFINRELSWMEFNHRVLEEAMDASNPLLERLKFFTICSGNLDEFFEVRVASLKQQIESGTTERGNDGLTAPEVFDALSHRVRRFVADLYNCWREHLVPGLARQGIRFFQYEELDPEDAEWINKYYLDYVRPVLTPLGIDPAHPFPQVLNRSLNLIVRLTPNPLDTINHTRMAIVQVPRVLPRLIRLPGEPSEQNYMFLGQLIGHFLRDLFPGMTILGYWLFRVTRNSELYIAEEEIDNLLQAVENELHNRRRGEAVRIEVEKNCPVDIRAHLLANLNLSNQDLYEIDGPLGPGRLMLIKDENHNPDLCDKPFVPQYPPALREAPDIFAAIRKRDVLLHHPYESFDAVVDFLNQAASDPQVLAIKQTLYRSGGDPRVVGALMKAVNLGKQVTAVVELRARFDEANNIEWARKLEEAGVHVVYGLVGFKIHGKICLVMRREENRIRRYVHLSTGNYNPTTAKIYTDIGLLTCHSDFGEDATNLFNLLTGICQYPGMRKFLVAPFELRDRLLALIRREEEHARQGLPARINAKLNALVDRTVIEALYRASQAGVQIDLIVRGICCLRPQVKGISDNITVRSIVDRFLEHSRLYYFENACQPDVFVASADWMPRNLYGRIEIAFPILNGVLGERIVQEIWRNTFGDTVKTRILEANGEYRRLTPPNPSASGRSQYEFMRLAMERKPAHSEPAVSLKTGQPAKYPKVKLAPKPRG